MGYDFGFLSGGTFALFSGLLLGGIKIDYKRGKNSFAHARNTSKATRAIWRSNRVGVQARYLAQQRLRIRIMLVGDTPEAVSA
jgi:hypothetical protein